MTKSTNKKNHKLTITAGITLPVVLFFVYYYNIGPRPDLEKYNLKEQLPKPQNEVVVNDRDIAKGIRHQKEVSVDFNRMYDELKGWKKNNMAKSTAGHRQLVQKNTPMSTI